MDKKFLRNGQRGSSQPKQAGPKPARRKNSSGELSTLITEVRQLIHAARQTAASAINTLQVLTNFEIGRRIIEHEQEGAKRAEYGSELLKELSTRLTEEFGRGWSATNLKLMRQFFVAYRDRIGQQATDQFPPFQIGQQSADQSIRQHRSSIELAVAQKPSEGLSSFATLSWTHYVVLLTIKDVNERSFYEIEAASSGWSVPELKRQKASALYERLALSRSKAGVKRLAREGQFVTKPEDILKEPYVLEFLGLNESAAWSESDLETALIDHSNISFWNWARAFYLRPGRSASPSMRITTS